MKKPDNKDKLPSEKKKPSQGKTNRTKGHNFERALAQEFRDLGYVDCRTSRQDSRLLDDSKVDLSRIPFNIQAKNVKAGINYAKLMRDMEEGISKNMPERSCFPFVIIHKKEKDQLVIMRKKDFYEYIKK